MKGSPFKGKLKMVYWRVCRVSRGGCFYPLKPKFMTSTEAALFAGTDEQLFVCGVDRFGRLHQRDITRHATTERTWLHGDIYEEPGAGLSVG